MPRIIENNCLSFVLLPVDIFKHSFLILQLASLVLFRQLYMQISFTTTFLGNEIWHIVDDDLSCTFIF